MKRIERHLRLGEQLLRLPATYLLGGSTLSVWVVFRVHHAGDTRWFVVAFLVVVSASVVSIVLRFDSRMSLLLVGAGLFGLYATGVQHRFHQKRQALGEGTRRWVGVYRGEGRFSVLEGFRFAPVDVYVSGPSWRRGTKLAVTAEVQGPVRPEGFRRYLRVQGFHGVVDIEAVHERSPPGGWRRVRYGLYRLVDRELDELAARWDRSTRFQRALILGQKEALPEPLLRLFRRLGISHLFVISGLHVGILFWLVRRLCEPLDRSLGLTAPTAVVFLYVAVLGWPVSATRAALMIGLYGLAGSLWRRPHGPTLLVGAVLCMFSWDPFVVLDVGFQLSVGAMVGIYAVHRYANGLSLFPGGDYLLYSTGAFLGVTPLVLLHFHYLSRWGFLFGWLGSLLFPLFLGGLCLQSGLMVTGWSLPADAGETLLWWAESGLRHGLRGTDLLLTVSGIHLLTVLVLGACLWIAVDGHRSVLVQGLACVPVLVLLLAVALPPTRPHLEVTLLNHRPALFLHNPHGVRALILSPGTVPGPGGLYGMETYLREKGVMELDVLVSSLTRRGLRGLGPQFVVDRLGVYGSEVTSVSWRGGGYDLRQRRLDSYFASIRYNNRTFNRVDDQGTEYVLTCPETGRCVVGERARRTESPRSKTRDKNTPRPLRGDPPRWVSPGRVRRGVRVTRTVEDQLVSFLPGY